MAKIVVTNSTFTLAAVSYDAQVERVELSMDSDMQETTNMDSAGWKEFLAGLKSWTVTVTWKKDADLSGLDLALWNAASAGNSLAMTSKLQDAAIATTNPEFQGNVFVTNYTPLGNSVGEVYSGSTTFQGTGALTRDVTP